jgi:hypothetical protein
MVPTMVVRPEVTKGFWLYDVVVHVDRAMNACPSLHAGWAVFVWLWGVRMRSRRHGMAEVVVWTALSVGVLYSTLATKQHVMWDIIGGGVLGAVSYYACVGLPLEGMMPAVQPEVMTSGAGREHDVPNE